MTLFKFFQILLKANYKARMSWMSSFVPSISHEPLAKQKAEFTFMCDRARISYSDELTEGGMKWKEKEDEKL